MKKSQIPLVTLVFLSVVNIALSEVVTTDTFVSRDGQVNLNIDFVTISGNASSSNGTIVGYEYPPTQSGHVTFTDPGNYRIGNFEITNDQWDKFLYSYGTVTGDPAIAYDQSAQYTGTNIPTNNVSWYQAAQFVNYLNTSTGHAPAYKFTGTQGAGNYTMKAWDVLDNGYNADNPFRNSQAKYFLPTEDEWVKAAYWNSTTLQLQDYATPDGSLPIEDVDTNYGHQTTSQPWNVGTGSKELNGTYDMMGNVSEWLESPCLNGDYIPNHQRVNRGGTCNVSVTTLSLSVRGTGTPNYEGSYLGFRVASVIPEPCSLVLFALSGLMMRQSKKRNNNSQL